MIRNPVLLDITAADAPMAIWNSTWINMASMSTKSISFHIVWTDCTLTWYLWRSNDNAILTSPPADDITASYRAIDPGWVDPVLGDPFSSHIVAFQNPVTHFVLLGFTGLVWTGASRQLRVILYREARINW